MATSHPYDMDDPDLDEIYQNLKDIANGKRRLKWTYPDEKACITPEERLRSKYPRQWCCNWSANISFLEDEDNIENTGDLWGPFPDSESSCGGDDSDNRNDEDGFWGVHPRFKVQDNNTMQLDEDEEDEDEEDEEDDDNDNYSESFNQSHDQMSSQSSGDSIQSVANSDYTAKRYHHLAGATCERQRKGYGHRARGWKVSEDDLRDLEKEIGIDLGDPALPPEYYDDFPKSYLHHGYQHFMWIFGSCVESKPFTRFNLDEPQSQGLGTRQAEYMVYITHCLNVKARAVRKTQPGAVEAFEEVLASGCLGDPDRERGDDILRKYWEATKDWRKANLEFWWWWYREKWAGMAMKIP
ncbi:hypothetical protein F5883DRAFT_623080 [Diaporthe sp. PMI_573]|nr:hypothetical protein F5883DRAFT_623080 [Diaporthaceae sp. PMI_573]